VQCSGAPVRSSLRAKEDITAVESIETIVIGAGQAGLATSYCLTQQGLDHVVLERGEVAQTWRSERWDGFVLNTPNFASRLPGYDYESTDPDGFAPLADVIAWFEGYGRSFGAPVRTGTAATALRRDGDGYLVETSAGTLAARNVVVSTGAFQVPTPRPFSDAPAGIMQLHTSEYQAPGQLPDGAVLIVGSGQSGCQIADELLDAGRTVYMSVGRCPWLPRRHRGRELVHWLRDLGILDQTVDSLASPAARLACNPPVSGNDGGHDCNARWLADRGTVLLGRIAGLRDGVAAFAPDLQENLEKGDTFLAEIRAGFDGYAEKRGLDLPAEPPAREREPVESRRELDLRAEGVGTILWANGFRPDFRWIELDLFDEYGWPVQKRGVTASPGLYFVGLNWLHKRKSALIFGVGEDAEYVVSRIAEG
jgi:putative flavoprotein involved in K+ transport